ncbi:hypothetical protein D3C86_1494080 [compost metagenome]
MDLQHRVIRDIADAALIFRRSHLVVVDRTRHRRLALAQPDVVVVLRRGPLTVKALGLQLVVEPRVVVVVDLHDMRIRRRIRHEPLIRLVRLQLRVHGHPDLGTTLADRRDQDVPRPLADRLALFHPASVDALVRLDRVHRVVSQPSEQELGPVLPPDCRLQYLVEPTEMQRLDLVRQQLVHRILDRLLHLTEAANPQWRLSPLDQQRTGESPRLPAAPPAVRHLVPVRVEQEREDLGKLGVNPHQACGRSP